MTADLTQDDLSFSAVYLQELISKQSHFCKF